MYAITLDADNRVLSATFAQYAPDGAIVVDMLPEGNIADYLYIEGSYVYNPRGV